MDIRLAVYGGDASLFDIKEALGLACVDGIVEKFNPEEMAEYLSGNCRVLIARDGSNGLLKFIVVARVVEGSMLEIGWLSMSPDFYFTELPSNLISILCVKSADIRGIRSKFLPKRWCWVYDELGMLWNKEKGYWQMEEMVC